MTVRASTRTRAVAVISEHSVEGSAVEWSAVEWGAQWGVSVRKVGRCVRNRLHNKWDEPCLFFRTTCSSYKPRLEDSYYVVQILQNVSCPSPPQPPSILRTFSSDSKPFNSWPPICSTHPQTWHVFRQTKSPHLYELRFNLEILGGYGRSKSRPKRQVNHFWEFSVSLESSYDALYILPSLFHEIPIWTFGRSKSRLAWWPVDLTRVCFERVADHNRRFVCGFRCPPPPQLYW
eukprot:654186-Prymnesium_polylepis.1